MFNFSVFLAALRAGYTNPHYPQDSCKNHPGEPYRRNRLEYRKYQGETEQTPPLSKQEIEIFRKGLRKMADDGIVRPDSIKLIKY